MKELDEEKEELRKYQQLDKQRKSLEYTIYDKELQDARQRLAEVSRNDLWCQHFFCVVLMEINRYMKFIVESFSYSY